MCRAAAPLIGLLLALILFFGLERACTGAPWHWRTASTMVWVFGCRFKLVTFYHMQSVAEAFFSALPQSI